MRPAVHHILRIQTGPRARRPGACGSGRSIRISATKSWERSSIDASEGGGVQASNEVIYPWDRRFQAWSTLATAAAAATGFFVPLEVAMGGGADT